MPQATVDVEPAEVMDALAGVNRQLAVLRNAGERMVQAGKLTTGELTEARANLSVASGVLSRLRAELSPLDADVRAAWSGQRLLLLIGGPAGAGKDTAAAYLARHWGFSHETFAAPLKRCLVAVFGIPYPDLFDPAAKEQPLPAPWANWTPRRLMQVVGTQLFREGLDPDVWVKSLAARIRRNPVVCRWVISDFRLENERRLADWLPAADGWRTVTLRIERDTPPPAGGVPGHVTEQGVPCEFTIRNDSSVYDLHARLRAWMAGLEAETLSARP